MTRAKLEVMRYLSFAIVIFLLSGCHEEEALIPPIDSAIEIPTKAAVKNTGIIHRVSVGGADICVDINIGEKPGCNGNFSLVATMKSDGSVKGQFTDQFGHGNGGFHATLNCLTVKGNEAWISGVITSGNTQNIDDLTGFTVITRVVDNGPSGDQISYSYLGTTISCDQEPDFPLFKLTGQVKIW